MLHVGKHPHAVSIQAASNHQRHQHAVTKACQLLMEEIQVTLGCYSRTRAALERKGEMVLQRVSYNAMC